MNLIVVPRVCVWWEDVAFALYYKIPTVDTIKQKHHDDPKKCCRALFIDWLSTNNGVSPKTWSTLLNAVSIIDELKAVSKEILTEMAQFSSATSGVFNITCMITIIQYTSL